MEQVRDSDAQDMPWRVGRKVGRTIYAQCCDEPSDEDPLIGVMDTPGLAAESVAAHNERLGYWAR